MAASLIISSVFNYFGHFVSFGLVARSRNKKHFYTNCLYLHSMLPTETFSSTKGTKLHTAKMNSYTTILVYFSAHRSVSPKKSLQQKKPTFCQARYFPSCRQSKTLNRPATTV